MNNKIIKFTLFFCLTLPAMPTFAENSRSAHCIESPKPYFVGELGALWEFPSDHLPRGATIGNFHIAFWNILNKNYLFHIEENTQGLRDSSILRDNIPIDSKSTLTIRELTSVQMIMEMITHPTHPRSLIGLEEVHPDVQNYLKKNLPISWEILTPPGQANSQDIFLYDTNVFTLIDLKAVKYSQKFPKTIFTITLREKDSNKVFRFLQSHIPGGPINSSEGCAKFAEEAFNQYDPDITMVLMGDMNQSPEVIQKVLENTAKKRGISQPFHYLPIGHPSHMNTHMEASWIDNFFIYTQDTLVLGSDLPEEICQALAQIVLTLVQSRQMEE